jgi:hypothetical protein
MPSAYQLFIRYGAAGTPTSRILNCAFAFFTIVQHDPLLLELLPAAQALLTKDVQYTDLIRQKYSQG